MTEPEPEVAPGSPWATVEQAREVWQNAPYDDALVGRLLRVTHSRCVAYAPTLADGAAVPEAYTHANVLAARDLWRHADLTDADPYTVGPLVLEAEVRALLRPRRAVPNLW